MFCACLRSYEQVFCVVLMSVYKKPCCTPCTDRVKNKNNNWQKRQTYKQKTTKTTATCSTNCRTFQDICRQCEHSYWHGVTTGCNCFTARRTASVPRVPSLPSVRGSQRRFPPKCIKNTFSLYRVHLYRQKCILRGAIKFVSVRSS